MRMESGLVKKKNNTKDLMKNLQANNDRSACVFINSCRRTGPVFENFKFIDIEILQNFRSSQGKSCNRRIIFQQIRPGT